MIFGPPPERALIVRPPWAGKIVDEQKFLELRKRRTKVRGRIGIIGAGTGTVIGEAWLEDSAIIAGKADPRADSTAEIAKAAGMKPGELIEWLEQGYCHAWFLSSAYRYAHPMPYDHPSGAVTWVRLQGRIGE